MSIYCFDDEMSGTIHVLIINYFKDKLRFVITKISTLVQAFFVNQFNLSITTFDGMGSITEVNTYFSLPLSNSKS